jgi:prenyltransferase beta subunit
MDCVQLSERGVPKEAFDQVARALDRRQLQPFVHCCRTPQGVFKVCLVDSTRINRRHRARIHSLSIFYARH